LRAALAQLLQREAAGLVIIAGSGAAADRHVAADRPDARRDLPVQSRH
jgi:hypothetical protein